MPRTKGISAFPVPYATAARLVGEDRLRAVASPKRRWNWEQRGVPGDVVLQILLEGLDPAAALGAAIPSRNLAAEAQRVRFERDHGPVIEYIIRRKVLTGSKEDLAFLRELLERLHRLDDEDWLQLGSAISRGKRRARVT